MIPFGTYGIFVFDEDQTVTSVSSNFSGPTSGLGAWKSTRDGHCAAVFEGFSDDNQDGAFDTRFNVRMTLRVRGNRIEGTGTFDLLELDGTFAFNAFAGFVIKGERMKVVRE